MQARPVPLSSMFVGATVVEAEPLVFVGATVVEAGTLVSDFAVATVGATLPLAAFSVGFANNLALRDVIATSNPAEMAVIATVPTAAGTVASAFRS